MKKTIAILIAALMLLSMIPMNVFAADEDVCKVPAGAEHTKDNCAAYTLIEVIDPVDCKMGYTLYSCDKCETVFADDFTWNPDGGHVWKTQEAAKPATCSKPAYKELQVCEVCGTPHPELNGKEVEGSKPVVGPTAEHTWNTPDIEDCVVADVEFTCTKCGATKTEKYDSHDYKDYPDAFVAPTCDADGTASFNCQRCDHVKTIVFKTEGHNKVVIPADPFVDCTKPGATAGEKCTICGKVFTAPVAGTPKDCKWELKSTITPATCDTDGKGVYECTNPGCDAEKEDIIPKAHKYGDKPNHTSPATCTAWGFDFYYCTVCGYLKPFEDADRHAPLGHVTYEEADVKATTGTDTCEEGGKVTKTWTCNRVVDGKACGYTGPDTTIVIDNYTEHKIVTVVVPAFCHQVGYTVDYCANPDCANPAVGKITVGTVELDLSVAVEGKDTLKLVPGKDADGKDHNGVYAVGTTLDANHHDLIDDIINDATCTEAGAKYERCPYCSYVSDPVEIPVKDHAYPETPNSFEPSTVCGVNGKNVFVCPDCGAIKKVEKPNSAPYAKHEYTIPHAAKAPTCLVAGNKAYNECKNCGAADSDYVIETVDCEYITLTTVAQCDGTLGRTWQECKWCHTKNDKFTEITAEYTYEATKTYNTWADAQDVHADLSKVGEVVRKGDCTKTGLIKYNCTKCNKDVLVVVLENPDNGKAYAEHHYPEKPNEDQVDPTCQNGGTGAIWYCTECGAKKGGEPLAKVDHNMKPSPCGDGTYCGFGCGEKTGAGYVDHVIVTEDKYKDATCTTIAFVHIYCKNCDTEDKTIEFMRYYAPELGHDYKKVEGYDSTCEATGLTDGTQCSRCDAWGTEQEVIAKKDHVNKGGVKLYDKCTDAATKDRDCTICKKTIGTTHNNAVDTIVQADCNSEGYTLYVCVDCKEKTMSDFKAIDPNHAWKEVDRQDATVLAEGWVKYECTVCKADGMTEYTKVETLPILTQIDIVLNATNAEETAGETFTDSSLVALTITLDSAKLSAWGVSFDLYYSENLQFVSAEFSAENKFSAIDKDNAIVNNNFDEKNNNLPDYVSISAIAPNTDDKKVQDVALEGKMEFVTLYFKVVNGDFNDVAYAEFYVANALIIDTKGEDKTTSSKVEVIELTKFMDYNGDNVVTIEDVLAATKIVSGELTKKNDKNEDVAVTYDVALDVDKDGEITYADLLAILNYINGAKSYADVTA